MNFADLPDMLDIRQCAKLLGCGRTKAYQLTASGAVRTLRIGRKMLIPKADVLALIEKNLKKSGTA